MKKKNKVRKISFTRKKKTVEDKLFEIVQNNTKLAVKVRKLKTKKKTKSGKKVARFRPVVVKGKKVWHRKGLGKLAKKLGIKEKELEKIVTGQKKTISKKLKQKISKLHKNENYSPTKIQTKEFTKHSFTQGNFFKKIPIRKLSDKEQYYFRCGLYMVFESNKHTGEEYIIHNLPVPTLHEARYNDYDEGFENAYWDIVDEISRHPSLKYFRINYFDVTIIDLSTSKRSESKGKNYISYK